jgi:NAD(P)-dependent dehydrogenase (short-subunit alcohol dehydrogenase family)
MILKDKKIVITGASKGLGRALAFKFAEEGARVALCARSTDELRRVELEISLRWAPPLVANCDVADHGQVERFSAMVLEEFGSVDVLVNNASQLGPRIEIAEWTSASWNRIIEVNVNGLFAVTVAFLPAMLRQGSGSIINVSSSVGRKGRARWGAYAASKFALEGFTQTLADEVKNKGVRVNSVNPGPMDTDMRHAAYPDEDRTKLKSPAEILDVFVFLASDRSRKISGQYFDAQEFQKTMEERA